MVQSAGEPPKVYEHKVYRMALAHVETLTERRQAVTPIYLTVNTAILAAMGFLVKDSHLQPGALNASVLLMLVAGLIACWIWHSLLKQYQILLRWWYELLREYEVNMSDENQMITREYKALYQPTSEKKHPRIGMTKYEIHLVYVLIGLYVVFGISLGIALL